MQEKKTKKCENDCGRRFRIRSFHIGLEKDFCMTCLCMLKAILDTCCNIVEKRATLILKYRFGILDKSLEIKTPQEMAKEFDVSVPRVLDIQNTGIDTIGTAMNDYPNLRGRFFGMNKKYGEKN